MSTFYLVNEYAIFSNDILRNQAIADNLDDARLIVKELQDTINERNYSKHLYNNKVVEYTDTTQYSWTEQTIEKNKGIEFIANFTIDVGDEDVKQVEKKHIEILFFKKGIIYDRKHNDKPMATNF